MLFVLGGLFLSFTSLMVLGGIAYSKDVQPSLTVSEPNPNTTIKSDKVVIKGAYEPKDRKVWVNGKQIAATGGVFETTYKLKEGENKIDVSAGDWKRAYVNLVVIRELTDAEKAAKISPTLTPTSTPSLESIKATVSQKISALTPTPKPTITTQPTVNTVTVENFPKKLENYMNNTWDEMPGTYYKVYWWDTWEGVDSGHTHLVVEPSFEPTSTQCQRIAQVATIYRVSALGKKEGVVHVAERDNSKDYCSLRTP